MTMVVRKKEANTTIKYSPILFHKPKPSIAQKFTGTKSKVTSRKVWEVNCNFLVFLVQTVAVPKHNVYAKRTKY